jgi:hypothetical protein
MIKSLGQYPRNISGTIFASYIARTNGKFNRVAFRYTTEKRRYIPFPHNTYGFLYYKGPEPGYPDFSGSFRFRTISMSFASSFADGADLRLPSGGVWQILLYTAIRSGAHYELVTKLLEEGLVTDSTVEKARALPHIRLRHATQILYKLEDPFYAELHRVNRIAAISEDGAKCCQIMDMFHDRRRQLQKHPYTGMP